MLRRSFRIAAVRAWLACDRPEGRYGDFRGLYLIGLNRREWPTMGPEQFQSILHHGPRDRLFVYCAVCSMIKKNVRSNLWNATTTEESVVQRRGATTYSANE